MRPESLLFVCSSLEPGRNGVGDYTRALAGALAEHGHEVRMIALNDAHVKGAGPVREEHGLRLPPTLSPGEKEACCRAFLGDRQPTVTSWQFVSYGYSAKGLTPPGLGSLARRLSGGTRHVMMHEIWLGFSPGTPLRQRLLGVVQRQLIARFLRGLAPAVTHTSNALYQEKLRGLGRQALLLPLFGNIAVEPPDKDALPASAREQLGRRDRLTVLLFGTVHAEWKPAAFAQWCLELGRDTGRRPVVLAAGRNGAHAPGALAALRAAGLDCLELGPLSGEQLSTLMQLSDLGLALHPWSLVNKSGVAAAMLEHGLPVLVPRDDSTEADRTGADPLLLPLGLADKARTQAWLGARRAPTRFLPRVARQFLDEVLASRNAKLA